ncbi:MAG: XdhC family protein [Eubacterium sp.]|nr:XdhC family protein [Eubacterium sp.]
MNPKKLLEEQLKLEEAGRPYAVVTIIRADGAVPRKSGKMLVTADGNSIGTIGGGSSELLAIQDAQACIRYGENAIKDYTLNSENGMVCGGDFSVFIEVENPRPRLLLCGAGHVGTALMKAARLAGFDITLVDTRGEEQIGDAILLSDTYVPVEDFYKGIMTLSIPAGAFIVITTYGHRFDKEALAAALTKKAAYLGMIGSRKKSQRFMKSFVPRALPMSSWKPSMHPLAWILAAKRLRRSPSPLSLKCWRSNINEVVCI